MVEELQGYHGHVESSGAIELPVPRLDYHVQDESDAPLVGGVIKCAIVNLSFVVGFRLLDFGGRGILCDAVVV